MRRIMIMTLLAGGLAASAPAPAAARDTLQVRSSALHPDRVLITLTLRCNAPRARCAGRLRAQSLDGVTVARTRPVRLPSRQPRRIAMRLAEDALHDLSEAGEETEVDLSLTPAGGRKRLIGFAALSLRVSCRSGTTIGSSPAVRLFRVEGFGVYACTDPHRRPDLVATEADALTGVSADSIAIAAPFVAFVTVGGNTCGFNSLSLYDLRAHRIVRTLSSQTASTDSANGCTGTTDTVTWLRGGSPRAAALA
ncbi:hypothetical protein DSM104299_02934 [Baekduia alba]|nr:hypothetical protein DSM104299_02934 [Baekduia alba]